MHQKTYSAFYLFQVVDGVKRESLEYIGPASGLLTYLYLHMNLVTIIQKYLLLLQVMIYTAIKEIRLLLKKHNLIEDNFYSWLLKNVGRNHFID